MVYRQIQTSEGCITAVYVSNLCDISYISEYIITPLIQVKKMTCDVEKIESEILSACMVERIDSLEIMLIRILSGYVILLFSFNDTIVCCDASTYDARAIEEPPTEVVIKGPREGFTENISQNVSLMRKKIRNVDLKFEKLLLGEQSNTTVILVYIENKTPKQLIEFVRSQLESIDVEAVLDPNYIEEKLKAKNTAFDTIGYTEKPDVAVNKVMEGRVAILADSSPFVATAPHFFIEELNMADDYYLNKYPQNYFRLIRWAALLIALLLPSLYLALTTYHFALIPSVFVFRLGVMRAGVPFPTVVEILVMMFFFQVLREAGIRLPQAIGPAISIVGALILGDAAIRSGLASEITVLVVALSSISLFLIPKLYGAITIWSNIMLLFSAFLGLPGFFTGFIVCCSHIASLESCGYPYLYPLGTLSRFSFKDHFIRDDLHDISGNILKEDEQG
ncbi:GerA spore germination protein [Alkaliphilus metalliredigens QYMF]|uniref:GerA spore germination protein n=1 Tax=Alkaliphilus metalliredigens (strain QYMF) TaxID=293826 RepID=A6TSP7_ALKMQ|nr:GerA spore germination protein [Alkaliphilus metalliredigens QYMF]